MQKTVTYSRNDLFDLVWSVPLLKLAKEIGVSDVALAKACRKVGIPLPGRGYWAKSEANRPKQTRMPKYTGQGSGDVTFTTLDPEAIRLPRKFDDAVPRISVPTSLVDPDLLVVATLKAAEKAKQYNGRVVLANKRVLDVSVSPAVLDRAMILLDTLIKACRQQGYPWKVSSEGKTIIQCDGHDIEVTLHERLSKKDLPRVRRERQYWDTGKGPFFGPQEYEWMSTNQLTFKVENPVAGGARRSWADGNSIKLESKLHEIVSGLPIVAQGIDALEVERAAWKKKIEDDEARRKERAQRAEATRRLREKLVDSMSRWERAQRIRVFCDQVEAKTKDTLEADQGAAWLSWARAQADMIDPLLGDLADLISTSVIVPDWFEGRPTPRDNEWWKT